MATIRKCSCPEKDECNKFYEDVLSLSEIHGKNSDFALLKGHIQVDLRFAKAEFPEQHKSTTSSAIWNRKCCDNIWGKRFSAKADPLPDGQRLYIHKYHFQIAQLKHVKEKFGDKYGENSVPNEIVAVGAETERLSLNKQDKIGGNKYWCLPTLSLKQIKSQVKTLLQDALTKATAKDAQIVLKVVQKSQGEYNIVDANRKEIIVEQSMAYVDSRSIRQVVLANCKRLRDEEDAKLDETKRQKEMRNTLPTDPRDWFKLHQAYEEKLKALEKQVEESYKAIKVRDERIADLELQRENEIIDRESAAIQNLGISRTTLLNASFHAKNSHMALHLFGFETLSEYIVFCKCAWPKLDFNTKLKAGSHLTDFEKLTLVKIVLTRNLTFQMLNIIYNVSESYVCRIVDRYMEWWGEVGLCLTSLSISPEYLKVSAVKAYKDNKMGDVSFGCDGKDIMCEKLNKSAFANRVLYSSKVSFEALRTIHFSLQSGLVVEHTIANGAHTSEPLMVEHWGSHVGNIHLLHNTERENRRAELESNNVFGPEYKKYLSESLGNGDGKKITHKTKTLVGEKEVIDSDAIIIDYIARLQEKADDNDESVSRNRVNIESIKRHNALILEHWGPDSDSKSKLRQIQILLRLYNCYKNGSLRRCSITHYIHHMYADLKEMEKCILSQDETLCRRVEARFLTRLGKFPKDTRGMADKGFAKIRFSLPNWNIIIHPHFASSGLQFTAAQLKQDQSVKELRWKDEGVFSRLTDEKFLATIVPYARLKHLQHAINWALARSNLKQPFYKPDDYDTFKYHYFFFNLNINFYKRPISSISET